MNIITSKDEISNILCEIDKPSLQRIDKSYYKDIEYIHCIVDFKLLSRFELDKLDYISIDESLIIHSSRIIIYIKSSIDLLKADVETITDTVSIKTNYLDYHINWQVDFDYDSDKFDLALIFVE